MRIIFLLIFVLLIAQSTNAQSIEEQIRNGMTLSFYLGDGDYDKIEKFILDHNYVYDSKTSETGLKYYNKNYDDFTKQTMIAFDTRYEDSFVTIFHKDDSEPFYFKKLQKFIRESEMFELYEGNSYFFKLRKREIKENASEVGDLYYYASVVDLHLKNEMISFYPPLTFEKYRYWDKIFNTLFVENLKGN